LNNWSVRIGGAALIALVLIALAAPWLGTVDPTLFDAGSRDLRPGASGEITTLEGETLHHRFLMGSDSFGRDIYSRVLYGTRVSLAVGLAAAALALAFGVVATVRRGGDTDTNAAIAGALLGAIACPSSDSDFVPCPVAIGVLGFLGVGLPPDIPTWGNIMAEGRVQFVAYPHNVFFPGIFLAVTVLAVNILGDGLRDTLDPKMAKRV